MASQNAAINIDATVNSTKDGRTTTGYIKGNNQLTDGTSANQANKGFYAKYTIVSTVYPEALDFAGGGLIDLNGDLINWVDIVGLVMAADPENTVNIAVGAHANAFDFGIGTTATMLIKPGEKKVLIDTPKDPGYPITLGTGDTIKLAIASGANQIIEVLAIGRNA